MTRRYAWTLPAAAAFALIFAIAWAKETAPWPIYLLAALAFLACLGWAAMLHSQSRSPRG
jgi:hypothetical protein